MLCKIYYAYDKKEYEKNENCVPVIEVNEIIVRLLCDGGKLVYNDNWTCEDIIFHVLQLGRKELLKKDLIFKEKTVEFDINSIL